MNFLQFFQSSSGENSSKRLAFLISIIIAGYGVISSTNAMIMEGKADQAVALWGYFFFYSAVLGGFVTLEMVTKIFEIKNGRNNDRNDNQ